MGTCTAERSWPRLAPLAAGAVVPVARRARRAARCARSRRVTGAPCPLCGATRAFVLFGHADGRWLDYGAVWVAVALALIAAASPAADRAAGPLPVIGALAWAWALAHTGTITS